MIVTFYDSNFRALQNNASLNVGEWNLVRRVVDFDDFNAISEAFVEDVNPTFVIFSDDLGRYKYGAFAGIPKLQENNQSVIQASDLKTILNNEIMFLFDCEENDNLKNVFDKIFSVVQEQIIQDTFNVEFDTTALNKIELDTLKPSAIEYDVYNVWSDLIVPYLKFYDIFIDTKIDLRNKKIIFTFLNAKSQIKTLKLYEIQNEYEKQVAGINDCQAIVKFGNQFVYGNKYILLNNNSITTDETKRDLLPVKNAIIFKTANEISEVDTLLIESAEQCLTTLINSRYNETIKINVSDTFFENDDFGVSYDVYVKKGQFYKNIPIGQIIENNKGIKTIIIGYKADDVVFYL